MVRGISILLRCMGIPPWISKHGFRLFGCRQEIIHVQQFVVFGIARQILVSIRCDGVVIGRCAAIFGESDVRVPEQIVLPVHDRTFPAHKQQRLVIGKQAHFVGGHQVAGRLLVAGTAASAASSGKASTGGFHCFLADQLGHIQQKKGGHRYKWDDGKSYAQCSYSKRALAFTGYFLGFKFVEDYIFESTLNSENVVSTINTYVQNEITKPREKSYDPIQKTTQFWLMTDSAVEDLYNQLYECIGTHDYTLVELFKLLSFAYKLSEIGFAVDIDQFFQKVYNAVNNMEPLSKEDLRYLELSMFDGSFLSSDSPNYPIFRQQCDELMTLMKEKSHARDDTQIAVLLKENDGWGKKFYEYVSSNRNIFPSEKAFLSKFNIDALFEKLRFSPPDDWLAFRHSISLIYNFSNLSDFYQDDLEPAKMLKEKLENVVLPSKIVNNTHKAWLIESLQDIIEKLAPSKPQQ